MYQTDDTIAAIGTALGGATRGMVRLSGPQMVQCLAHCFQSEPPDRVTTAVRPQVISGKLVVDCPWRESPLAIPCDLFLWPSSRSYTRQPTAELHLPGSAPLLEMVLDELCAHGARVAEPGEFTLRAFLAGRIDLTRAEAVLGVIDAGSSQQFDVALDQMAGGLSRPLLMLREKLLQLLAQIEAGLDFVEEDIEFITCDQILSQLSSAQDIVGAVQEKMVSRGDQTGLPRVVLQGKANAGKSSLFNALLRHNRSVHGIQPQSLVSERSGTTRDYVTARLQRANFSCELIDTAGDMSQTTQSAVAFAAQAIAQEQQRRADVLLFCIAAPWVMQDPSVWETVEYDTFDLILITHCDLVGESFSRKHLSDCIPAGALLCSGLTEEGLPAVFDAIEDLVLGTVDSGPQAVATTAIRCASSLRTTEQSLGHAHHLAFENGGMELISTELRIALDALGEVVGAVYTDDILDRVFSQFCIGK
ncbi:MAG: GTPase [Pirellulales bacterium]